MNRGEVGEVSIQSFGVHDAHHHGRIAHSPHHYIINIIDERLVATLR